MTQKIRIREDFRRDGLAANCLADAQMINYVAKSFPGSIINIGYPKICSQEFEVCKSIIEFNENEDVELAVVGHSSQDHLEVLKSLVNGRKNCSANVWIPTSKQFISETFKTSPEKVLEKALSGLEYWKKHSNKPLDIALADVTNQEKEIPERVRLWTETLIKNGARRIIICDTKGIGTPKKLESVVKSLSKGNLMDKVEFHPHNDNSMALENISYLISQGISTIGSSIYGAGERKTMVDPRNLVPLGLEFNSQEFSNFETRYRKLIGDPEEILNQVFNPNIVVTGTQYRLRGRKASLKLLFGVTSDTHIASLLSGREISPKELSNLKNQALYLAKKTFLTSDELRAQIS